MSPGGPEPQRGRVTLSDVATEAGVSVALVSIVVRGVPGASADTRRRVLAVAERLGYRPDQRARLLRQQRSKLLGVTFGVQHAFHGELVDRIYQAADLAGYEVLLSAVTPNRSETRAIDTLRADRCEALILIGSQLHNAALADLGREFPVVVVTRRLRRPTLDLVDAVHTADSAGLQLAVDHLVGLGHRRIVHLDGGAAPGAADRRQGYRAAMKRHRLVDQSRVIPGGLTESDGAAATRGLLTSDLPTAIIAFNDDSASGVLDTLLRHGIAVPEQVSVMGYDDSRLARLDHVRLTTIGQDTAELARLAVQRAIDRLDPTFTADHELVTTPHLIVRATTAVPPSTHSLASS